MTRFRDILCKQNNRKYFLLLLFLCAFSSVSAQLYFSGNAQITVTENTKVYISGSVKHISYGKVFIVQKGSISNPTQLSAKIIYSISEDKSKAGIAKSEVKKIKKVEKEHLIADEKQDTNKVVSRFLPLQKYNNLLVLFIKTQFVNVQDTLPKANILITENSINFSHFEDVELSIGKAICQNRNSNKVNLCFSSRPPPEFQI